jgi:hypothetical protein
MKTTAVKKRRHSKKTTQEYEKPERKKEDMSCEVVLMNISSLHEDSPLHFTRVISFDWNQIQEKLLKISLILLLGVSFETHLHFHRSFPYLWILLVVVFMSLLIF